MGWLVIEGKGGVGSRGRRVEIPEAGTVLCGRSSHADLILPATAVSRRHAIFFHEEGRDWVRDAGSTNGTRVNETRVEDPFPLTEGDVVQVGVVDLVYREYVARARGRTLPKAEIEPTPGRLLTDTPRWRDVTLVGKGGMGEVYRARDRDLAVTVAIKRLRRRAGRSAGLLERLHAREAALGRTIEHPNVVRVLEEGVWGGDPLLLLEWVDGLDLAARTVQLAPLDRLEALRQTALGLDAAHRAGIVHADLKPANLLLYSEPIEGAEENCEILESPDEEPEPLEEDALQREIAERIGLPEKPDLDPLPFVGREGELAYLEEIASEVETGGTRWVLLYGERGVGRQRLVAEARHRAEAEGSPIPIEMPQEWAPPPPDFEGVWITRLPPFFPDDDDFARAAESARAEGKVRELFLKPFLRGQAIRLVERICGDPRSARAFIDAVDRETAAHPAQLADALESAFDLGAWRISGSGYRLDPGVLVVDDRAAAQSMFERLRGEEKGLRDLLARLSPIGGALDFDAVREITEFNAASLYYLLEHAERAGYLVREGTRELRFANEPLRRRLESTLAPGELRRRVRRALPVLAKRIASAPPASVDLHLGAAELAQREGRLDDAFRWSVQGALIARQRYERERFFAAVDRARACYRQAGEGSSRRTLQALGEEMLGPGGRGLDGLDRLRRLPVKVVVKIADFGIARRIDSDAGSGENDEIPWGTPRYMSPEQAKGQALGTPSDIFSLGIVARELLDGRHPLGDLRGKAAAQAIIAGGAAPRAATEPREDRLTDLLRRMLRLEPSERPNALEVADELQRAQIRQALGS